MTRNMQVLAACLCASIMLVVYEARCNFFLQQELRASRSEARLYYKALDELTPTATAQQVDIILKNIRH